eukprot:scaffold256722_cov35-Tisochrysis_lutea.AAC.3
MEQGSRQPDMVRCFPPGAGSREAPRPCQEQSRNVAAPRATTKQQLPLRPGDPKPHEHRPVLCATRRWSQHLGPPQRRWREELEQQGTRRSPSPACLDSPRPRPRHRARR